jgi:cell wall-associated NlpC family hydrolase
VAATAVPQNTPAPTKPKLTKKQIKAKKQREKRKRQKQRANRARSSLVRVGLNQLGESYVAGAAGPNRFDCSGFTQFVYKKATGKYLPHYSGAQMNKARRVGKKHMKPGDLLFFGPGGSQHVAMYIGKGKMVHATNPRTDVRDRQRQQRLLARALRRCRPHHRGLSPSPRAGRLMAARSCDAQKWHCPPAHFRNPPSLSGPGARFGQVRVGSIRTNLARVRPRRHVRAHDR